MNNTELIYKTLISLREKLINKLHQQLIVKIRNKKIKKNWKWK
jgi:hypothetical protein